MNICIANLSSTVNDQELKQLFSGYGEVKSAEVMIDVFTGESRGFGYVEMEDEKAAQKAVTELSGTEFQSQTISVKEAQPKENHKGSYKVGSGPVNAYRFRKN